MSCSGTSSCTCGCCTGISVQTPQVETNPPGQPAISYRTGTWATFFESMLARLSSSDYPALNSLTTRDDDDFTIALLDATSVMLDILTFYQERLANESYLRTAVQLESLVELSRLIGYHPAPGIAAAAYVAFTLKTTPGQAPNPSLPPITIPQGTQLQSVPAQGQAPQIFETSAAIPAKPDWNALPVMTGIRWIPPGASGLYLSGTKTQLQLGDLLLILGVKRENWSPSSQNPSEQWDIVTINTIQADTARQITYVGWDKRVTHATGDGTSGNTAKWTTAKVFAFRQKAALFGHNAPDPNVFVAPNSSPPSPTLPNLIDSTTIPWTWDNFEIPSSSQIDLDSSYSKVVVGSWFALASPTANTFVVDAAGNLWLEWPPLGQPSAIVQVDAGLYQGSVQPLSATSVLVLDNSSNLWLEEAPLGLSVPPMRTQVDSNVFQFQGFSESQVFVLDNFIDLWLDQAPFGQTVPPADRIQIDASVYQFQAVSASQVFVLYSTLALNLDQAPFGSIVPPANSVSVDDGIYNFQALSAEQVFVLDSSLNLWFEQAPFGLTVPPANRAQVDTNVWQFQALSANQVFVTDKSNNLWFEQAPFGSANKVQVDTNVKFFQALSINEVLMVDWSGNSWLEYGPFGKSIPPTRIQVNAVQIAVAPGTAPSVAQLYKVQQSASVSLAKFGVTAKVTELSADFADPNIRAQFQLRPTQVLAQSDQLTIAEQPLAYPLYGSSIDLQDLRPDLAQATVFAISGTQQKLTVNVDGLDFLPDDDSVHLTLLPGDVLVITNPAPLLSVTGAQWTSGSGTLTLSVLDPSGRPGTVRANLTDFILAASSSSDPQVSESALGSVSSVTDPYPHTLITLPAPLQNCYNRQTAAVNVNVVLATNGRSVSEIMGSGSASAPNKTFTLKQSPLTYVQASTQTGWESTLQVQVSGVDWTEVPSLYQQPSSAQVFATLNQSDSTTEVIFGDDIEGATLPTGQNNQANYRIGSGSAGNAGAGALSILVDRPVGVSGVTNPEAATGGQDPQSVDGIRSNAPQTVLTLGRAVSITDYQSYAATFAGIAKAYAIWIPAGPARGVFLTVAGVNGEALPAGNPTLGNLISSLAEFSNHLIPVKVVSFLETLFSLRASLQYDPAYDQPTVQAQVLATLYDTYSFGNRNFGRGVSGDEVATVIQAVPGVIAVNVTSIKAGPTSSAGDLASMGAPFTITILNQWLQSQLTTPLPRPSAGSSTRICPYLPVPSLTAWPQPAEILVLDPDPSKVRLGVMS